MELYDVMRTTPAVREFTADPLPDDVLQPILDNARFAPSGGNRQGAKVVVVRDRATRETLAQLTIPGLQRYFAQLANGEDPWNPLQQSHVTPEQIRQVEVPPEMAAPYRDAPLVLVLCLDLNTVAAADQYLDRIGVISGASIYPMAWNILLAARNEGYGGAITTMAIPEEPRIKELLGVPNSYAIAAVMPLGKPTRQLTKLKRKSVAEIAARERFDGEPFGPQSNPGETRCYAATGGTGLRPVSSNASLNQPVSHCHITAGKCISVETVRPECREHAGRRQSETDCN